jgi:adenine C2-methylase RlmN of 23S rRNA A2503 and tRNA A37
MDRGPKLGVSLAGSLHAERDALQDEIVPLNPKAIKRLAAIVPDAGVSCADA